MVETRRGSSSSKRPLGDTSSPIPNCKRSKAGDETSSNNEAKTLDPGKNLGDQEAKSVDKGKRKADVAQPENSTDAVVIGDPLMSRMSLDQSLYKPKTSGSLLNRGKKPQVKVADVGVAWGKLISQHSKALAMDAVIHSSSFLLPEIPAGAGAAGLKYALVLLNQRLPKFTPLLWNHAELRVCADGGANRVYDDLPLLFPHETPSDVRNRYKPDVIKGDMDSIRTEVLEFYKNMGTKIVDESHDQDTTDLHKCVAFIRDFHTDTKDTLCILVAGALGGRFDHEIGNINVICHFSSIRIILLSEDSIIQLLPKARHHEIHIQSSVEGPHCGLIPIGTPSRSTTTTGLQWDLDNTEMRFGGLISTSNIVRGEIVTVQSDSDLLWTISLKRS